MIITLEGIDASGKATQAKKLVEALGKFGGHLVSTYDFPHYQTLTGQAILGLLKGEWGIARKPPFETSYHIDVGDLSPDAVVDFIAAVEKGYGSLLQSKVISPEHVEMRVTGPTKEDDAKADAVRALVLQCLMTVNRLEVGTLLQSYAGSKSRHLVLDRYFASGLVYGASDGLDFAYLVDIHKLIPPSDLWLFLDIPAAESAKRRPERRDAYEKREGFMEKVRTKYLDLFTGWTIARPTGESLGRASDVIGGKWVVVDGLGTPDEVHGRIMEAVGGVL